MLIPRVLLAFCAFCALSASSDAVAQGALVVNTGNTLNCVSATGETGFNIQSWGIGGSLTVSTGPGTSAGKLSISDITLVKTVDACSGQLQQKFLTGVDLPSFTLTQYSIAGAGARAMPILLVTLFNPIMNTYTIAGGVNAAPAETLTITFSKVCLKEWKQNAEGTLEAQPQVCYDAVANKTGSS